MWRAFGPYAAALLLTGAPTALAAQNAAALSGSILDAVSGKGITNATVAVTTSGASARTDSLGRFRIDGLRPGIHRFLVSADGYARGALSLAFAAKERMERDLELEPASTPAAGAASGLTAADTSKAQALPTVPVTADPSLGRRFADFERRRATGRGQYRTREELEKANSYTLQDAMRSMRGVRFSCAGGTCRAQMVRAPLGCSPEYIVDERVDNAFGPTIPIRDIVGLEVYSGASDVPGEFAGRNSGCGVIVIWTTAGREPRRK
ncbi:carboxypeptidase regulatory-like domain-containing protein [Gemmatimonas sp.]|uniref:TonB-dependent receptor n=1 Tax=Gemmatimonas sp. TaxID=1962908 RepID=UPI00391A989A